LLHAASSNLLAPSLFSRRNERCYFKVKINISSLDFTWVQPPLPVVPNPALSVEASFVVIMAYYVAGARVKKKKKKIRVGVV